MSVRRTLAAVVAVGVALVPANAWADDAAPPASFPVVGAGYGHAVGMSQWGAYGMAKAGFDVTGIVTHYYSGTTVTPVQDDMDARINLLYHVGSAKMRSEVLDPSGGAVEVTVGGAVVGGGPADEFRFGVNGPAVNVQKITAGVATDLGTAPTVTSVSPNSGTTAGGTAVTITGTNFATGATVTFGGTAATNVVVASSTSITATTPA